MDSYDIKLNREELVGLLTESDAMTGLIEGVVNQVLEAQMSEHLGAERYVHTNDRQGYRNGYRTRPLYTRVGALTLQVPQTRDGSFSTEIFKRYQRSEKAFVLGLMEMYLQGVSTRKVTKITESLCGVSFSKSTVSQLCTELDVRLKAWRDRRLDHCRYPFLLADALVIDVRRDQAVRSTGALIVYGVNEAGQREPLDLLLADSETQASWETLFQRLKSRGLKGVDLMVSDNHAGLVTALKKHFQGAQWQRCQTHFLRNILGHCGRSHRQALAGRLKLIFQAEDKTTARHIANAIMDDFENRAPKAMTCLEEGLESALTILSFPAPYRKRLRTTNLPERMNEEIRRRQRVIRIFPNEAAAERLIGALLAEMYDKWQEGIAYLNMTEYWDWKKEEAEKPTSHNVVIF